jgi:tetratricopeptide (TPR) repeat protein
MPTHGSARYERMAQRIGHTLEHRDLAGMVVCALLMIGAFARPARAADLDASYDLLRTGQYEKCLESAQKQLQADEYSPQQVDWSILIVKSLIALGQYDQAATEMEAALARDPVDIRLGQLAYEAYKQDGQAEQASRMVSRVYRVATQRRLSGFRPADVVALGEALLVLGGDPKTILGEFYNRAIQADPNCREAYLAAGELAIAKQDYDLAAQQYRKAIARFADEPDAHYGLAQAFYQSDRKAMLESLDAALFLNPRHAPSLVLLAEHQIDAEDYDGAAKTLDRVIEVNPWNPQAWAYRAVLAYLANDPNKSNECRAKAMRFWSTNPDVDYLIGRKLSQKYRFLEGSSFQRQSLVLDPAYLPAKGQLADDLLRLGQEQQGWLAAEEVHVRDPYNVSAYNLVTLRDNMAKLKTLTTEGFVVRMEPVEADIYGDRVVKLLGQASTTLCRKYGLKLTAPVTVELFTNQQDFAVRTFGMPGGDGFLGVCFGNVITANSPKLVQPANWQATLWHEFTHVVTLNLTQNKMPRWLSEGISVYEELQRDPRWGQQMTPQYRQMILGDDLTPVGKLSEAFMSPPTPMHLQFAYYESELVVEFLVQQYGMDSIKAILADLRDGAQINDAISRRAASIGKFEEQFASFARKRAQDLAPSVDWEQPDKKTVDPTDPQAVAAWLGKHPNSFWALTLYADHLLTEQKWEQAKAPLEKLISIYPQYAAQDSAFVLLARVCRKLEQTDQEQQVLTKLAAASADATDAYARLMEMAVDQKDWRKVLENGNRYLSVYPMLPAVYSRMGQAYEALGQDGQAIESYQRLLRLDPADPVQVHYHLAKLLRDKDPQVAKRHVLEALADAPRFREAQKLLLQIHADNDAVAPASGGAAR